MTARRWRAVIVAMIAAAAAGSGIAAVLISARIAGIALSVMVILLAFLLYYELERATELRDRTIIAERLLATTNTHLERAEAIDPITRLATRSALFAQLQREFSEASRHGRRLAFILLDLDHFASVNEQYGEHFGDTVLAQVATLLGQDLRAADVAARYDGEEFALLLPGATAVQAISAAERIRLRLKGHVFTNGVVACSISASFGVSGLPDARIGRADDLVLLAAQALAEAKRRGRNRIVPDPPCDPGFESSPLSLLSTLDPRAIFTPDCPGVVSNSSARGPLQTRLERHDV